MLIPIAYSVPFIPRGHQLQPALLTAPTPTTHLTNLSIKTWVENTVLYAKSAVRCIKALRLSVARRLINSQSPRMQKCLNYGLEGHTCGCKSEKSRQHLLQ